MASSETNRFIETNVELFSEDGIVPGRFDFADACSLCVTPRSMCINRGDGPRFMNLGNGLVPTLDIETRSRFDLAKFDEIGAQAFAMTIVDMVNGELCDEDYQTYMCARIQGLRAR